MTRSTSTAVPSLETEVEARPAKVRVRLRYDGAEYRVEVPGRLWGWRTVEKDCSEARMRNLAEKLAKSSHPTDPTVIAEF